MQATILFQTSNVSNAISSSEAHIHAECFKLRNIASQIEETGTSHDKNISKLIDINTKPLSKKKKKEVIRNLIVSEAFDKLQDSQPEKIIAMFAQNIVKDVPCIGSPCLNFIFDFLRFYICAI